MPPVRICIVVVAMFCILAKKVTFCVTDARILDDDRAPIPVDGDRNLLCASPASKS